MPDITLLSVNNENLIKITETIAEEIWNQHYIPIIGKDQVNYMLKKFQSKKAISSQIKEGYFYYLINYKEANIGYFSFMLKDKHLLLSKIYIKTEHKGKGFGKKVFEFIEKSAKENNLNEIILTVNKNNINSIEAYKKCGFTIIDSIIQDIGNGFFMDDYLMKKALMNYNL